MTTDELVKAAGPKIGALGSAFYFEAKTMAKGKELGLDAFRFYVLGRGGVLGDAEPEVISSAFGYFNPAVIQKIWSSAREKVAPREAGRLYLECCRDFGRARFADIEGLDAFCQAAQAVNDAAEPAGLALYAGIAAEPLAEDLPGRAMQLVAVLREFRGSAHLVAVVASGLEPKIAHYLRRPDDYATFGWGDKAPTVTDAQRAKQQEADALTDRLVQPAFSVLSDADGTALMTGLERMEKAVQG